MSNTPWGQTDAGISAFNSNQFTMGSGGDDPEDNRRRNNLFNAAFLQGKTSRNMQDDDDDDDEQGQEDVPNVIKKTSRKIAKETKKRKQNLINQNGDEEDDTLEPIDEDATNEKDAEYVASLNIYNLKPPTLSGLQGIYYNLAQINNLLQEFVMWIRQNTTSESNPVEAGNIKEYIKQSNIYENVIGIKALERVIRDRGMNPTPQLSTTIKTVQDLGRYLSYYLDSHKCNYRQSLPYWNNKIRTFKYMFHDETYPTLNIEELLQVFRDDTNGVFENMFDRLTSVYGEVLSERPSFRATMLAQPNKLENRSLKRSKIQKKEYFSNENQIGSGSGMADEGDLYATPSSITVLNADELNNRTWSEQNIQILNVPYVQGFPSDEYNLPSTIDGMRNLVRHSETAVNYSLNPLTRSLIITMNTEEAMARIYENIQTNLGRRMTENDTVPRQIIIGQYGIHQDPIPDNVQLNRMVISNYLTSEDFRETVDFYLKDALTNSAISKYTNYYSNYFRNSPTILNGLHQTTQVRDIIHLLSLDKNLSATILKNYLSKGDSSNIISLANTMTTLMPDHYNCIINSFPDFGSRGNSVNSYYFNPCLVAGIKQVLQGSKGTITQHALEDIDYHAKQASKNNTYSTYLKSNYNNVILPYDDFIKTISDTAECSLLYIESIGLMDCVQNHLQRYQIYRNNAEALSKIILSSLTVNNYDSFGKGQSLGEMEQQEVFYALLNDFSFTPMWYYVPQGSDKTLLEQCLTHYSYNHNEFLNRLGSATFQGWSFRNFTASVSRYHDVPVSLKLPYLALSVMSENRSLDYVSNLDIEKLFDKGYFYHLIGLLKANQNSGNESAQELEKVLECAKILFTSSYNTYYMNYFIENPSYIHLMRLINKTVMSLQKSYTPINEKYESIKHFISPDYRTDLNLINFTESDNQNLEFIVSGIKIAPFSSEKGQILIEDRSGCLLHDSDIPDIYAITDYYGTYEEIVKGNLAFLPMKLSVNSNFYYDNHSYNINSVGNYSKLVITKEAIKLNPKRMHEQRLKIYFDETIIPRLDRLNFYENSNRDSSIGRIIKVFKEKNIEFKSKASILANIKNNNEIIIKILDTLKNQELTNEAHRDLNIKYETINMENQQLREQIEKIEQISSDMYKKIEYNISEKFKENSDIVKEWNQNHSDEVNSMNLDIKSTLENSINTDPEIKKMLLSQALEKCMARFVRIGTSYNLVVNMCTKLTLDKEELDKENSQWSITAKKILRALSSNFDQNISQLTTTEELLGAVKKAIKDDKFVKSIKEYDSLIKRVQELEEKIEKAKGQYTTTITEKDQKLHDLEMQVNKYKDTDKKLNAKLQAEKEVVKKHLEELRIEKERVASLKLQLEMNDTLNTAEKKKLEEDLQQAIQNTRDALTTKYAKELTEKINRIEELENLQEASNTTIESLKKDIIRLNKDKDLYIDEHQEKIEKLKDIIRQNGNELLKAQQAYDNINEEKIKAENTTAQLRNDISKLTQDYESQNLLLTDTQEKMETLSKEYNTSRNNAKSLIKNIIRNASVNIGGETYIYNNINKELINDINNSLKLFKIEISEINGLETFFRLVETSKTVKTKLDELENIMNEVKKEASNYKEELENVSSINQDMLTKIYNNITNITSEEVYKLVKEAFNTSANLSVISYTVNSDGKYLNAQLELINKIKSLLKDAKRNNNLKSIATLDEQLRQATEKYIKFDDEIKKLKQVETDLTVAKNTLNQSYEELTLKYQESCRELTEYKKKSEILAKLKKFYEITDSVQQTSMFEDINFKQSLEDFKIIVEQFEKQKSLGKKQLKQYEELQALYQQKLNNLDKLDEDYNQILNERKQTANEIEQLSKELRNAKSEESLNKKKIESLDNTLKEKTKDYTKLNEKFKNIEQNYNLEKNNVQSLQIELNTVAKKINNLEELLATSNQKLKETKEKLNLTEKQNTDLNKAKENMEEQLKQEISSLKNRISYTEKELEQSKNNLNSTDKEKSVQLEQLRSQLNEKDTQLQLLRINTIKLEGKIQQLGREIEILTSNLSEKDELLKKNMEETNTLDENLTKTKNELNKIQQSRQDIIDKIIEYGKIVDQDSDNITDILRSLKESYEDHQRVIEKLELQKNNYENDLNRVTEEGQLLYNQIEQLKNTNQNLNLTIETMKLNDESNLDKIKKQNDEIEKLKEEIDLLYGEKQIILDDLNQANNDRLELEKAMAKSNKSIEELQIQYDEKLKEIERLGQNGLDNIQKQKILELDLTELRNRIMMHEENFKKQEKKLKKVVDYCQKQIDEVKNLNLKITNLETGLDEDKIQIATLEALIRELSDRAQINSELLDTEEIPERFLLVSRDEHYVLLNTIGSLEAQVNELKEKIENVNDEIPHITNTALDTVNVIKQNIYPFTNNNDTIAISASNPYYDEFNDKVIYDDNYNNNAQPPEVEYDSEGNSVRVMYNEDVEYDSDETMIPSEDEISTTSYVKKKPLNLDYFLDDSSPTPPNPPSPTPSESGGFFKKFFDPKEYETMIPPYDDEPEDPNDPDNMDYQYQDYKGNDDSSSDMMGWSDSEESVNPGFGSSFAKTYKKTNKNLLKKSGITRKTKKKTNYSSFMSKGPVSLRSGSKSGSSSGSSSGSKNIISLDRVKFRLVNGKIEATLPNGKVETILDGNCFIEVDCDEIDNNCNRKKLNCGYQGQFLKNISGYKRKCKPKKKKVWCCKGCKDKGTTVGCCSK